eukprot:259166_1
MENDIPEESVVVYSAELFGELIKSAQHAQSDSDFATRSATHSSQVTLSHELSRGTTGIASQSGSLTGSNVSGGLKRTRSASALRRQSQHKLSIFKQESKKVEREESRRAQAALTKKRVREEARFHRLLQALKEADRAFDEATEFIERTDAGQFRTSRERYKEWYTNVFEKIQRQIDENLTPSAFWRMKRERRKLYDQYLEHCAAAKGLFLDTVIESEYDPFSQQKHQLHYSLSQVKDPLKADLMKLNEEKKLIEHEGTHSLLRRAIIHPTQYDKFKTTKKRLFEGRSATPFNPNIILDEYNVNRDPSIAQAELFPSPKKRPNA